MHVKINDAINMALRINPMQPVLHRLDFRWPHRRRRLKPVNLTGRTLLTDNKCRAVPHYSRMPLELYNQFEHYNTPTQERTDLLYIRNTPDDTRERLKFASAQDFQDFMERDNHGHLPLILYREPHSMSYLMCIVLAFLYINYVTFCDTLYISYVTLCIGYGCVQGNVRML